MTNLSHLSDLIEELRVYAQSIVTENPLLLDNVNAILLSLELIQLNPTLIRFNPKDFDDTGFTPEEIKVGITVQPLSLKTPPTHHENPLNTPRGALQSSASQ
jgi:hypothetical protein